MLSPDGKLAANGSFISSDAMIWNTSNGSLVRRLSLRGNVNFSVGWSADGTAVGWGTEAAANGAGPALLSAYGDLTKAFSLADFLFQEARPDFRRGILKRNDFAVERLEDGKLGIKRKDQAMTSIDARVYGEYYSATLLGENHVALGFSNGLIGVYDLASAKLVRLLKGHTGVVWALAPSPDGRYLLSGSNDRTLKIWRQDQDEELLTLFVTEDEDWVAWTPDGYYAASPSGPQFMGWYLNNGPEKLASFQPAGQFQLDALPPRCDLQADRHRQRRQGPAPGR